VERHPKTGEQTRLSKPPSTEGRVVQFLLLGRSAIGTLVAVAMLAGCGGNGGQETISSSVVGSLPCYPNADHWWNAETYKTNFGQYPSADDDNDVGVGLSPGDHVQILEQHLYDERPGLVTVKGGVDELKVLSGVAEGQTCWVSTNSNPFGPLYE